MTSTSASRWESSSRPLVVRTVWVNGLRHAILTPPLELGLPRPGRERWPASGDRGNRTSSPSSASATSTASDDSDKDRRQVADGAAVPRDDDLSRCLVRWKVLVARPREDGHGDADDDAGADADGEEECEDQGGKDSGGTALLGSYTTTYQPLCVDGNVLAAAPPDGSADTDPEQVDATAQQTPRRHGDAGSDLNPLSERVLQWLDLAGRGDCHGPVAKSGQRRNVSTACSASAASRRLHTAPRTRKFYPVAASEVPGPGPAAGVDRQRMTLSSARRSASVDVVPAAAPRAETQGLARTTRTPTPPTPPSAPPIVQTFGTTWSYSHGRGGQSSAQPSQSRPQLHIFVPALQGGREAPAAGDLQEVSDCESGISDA